VWLYEQLAFANSGDTILLRQDAVLALHSPVTLASFLAKCEVAEITIAALEEDCRHRGIVSKYPAISLITYSQFVDLVCQHNKQVSW
jgi:sulfur relay protein TusB/DsrH